jgi:hypothetical protein
MFIRKSKYDSLLVDALGNKKKYGELLSDWNALVQRINDLGGMPFLREAEASRDALKVIAKAKEKTQ